MSRNWELLERLKNLDDDVLIDAHEAAALTGFSVTTVQQRKVKTFPPPIQGMRRLRWKIGQIRAWGREGTAAKN